MSLLTPTFITGVAAAAAGAASLWFLALEKARHRSLPETEITDLGDILGLLRNKAHTKSGGSVRAEFSAEVIGDVHSGPCISVTRIRRTYDIDGVRRQQTVTYNVDVSPFTLYTVSKKRPRSNQGLSATSSIAVDPDTIVSGIAELHLPHVTDWEAVTDKDVIRSFHLMFSKLPSNVRVTYEHRNEWLDIGDRIYAMGHAKQLPDGSIQLYHSRDSPYPFILTTESTMALKQRLSTSNPLVLSLSVGAFFGGLGLVAWQLAPHLKPEASVSAPIQPVSSEPLVVTAAAVDAADLAQPADSATTPSTAVELSEAAK